MYNLARADAKLAANLSKYEIKQRKIDQDAIILAAVLLK